MPGGGRAGCLLWVNCIAGVKRWLKATDGVRGVGLVAGSSTAPLAKCARGFAQDDRFGEGWWKAVDPVRSAQGSVFRPVSRAPPATLVVAGLQNRRFRAWHSILHRESCYLRSVLRLLLVLWAYSSGVPSHVPFCERSSQECVEREDAICGCFDCVSTNRGCSFGACLGL